MRLLLLPLLVSTVVHGQNLLVNPTFNADLSSWTVEAPLGGSALWTPDDATSEPGSGSARLINTVSCTPRGCPVVGLSQCVAVASRLPYRVAFRVAALNPQTTTGLTSMQWQWFSGAGCSGGLDAHNIDEVPGPDWSLASRDISSPPGAGSALVTIVAIRNESAGTYAFNVDDLFFGPAPADAPVSVPGTSTLGAAVFSCLIGGVAVITLRRAAA